MWLQWVLLAFRHTLTRYRRSSRGRGLETKWVYPVRGCAVLWKSLITDIHNWLEWGEHDLRDSSSGGGKEGAGGAHDSLSQTLCLWNSSRGVVEDILLHEEDGSEGEREVR